MKSIHIICHCWNPPGVTEYAQTLKWQIASLRKHCTDFNVWLEACFAEADDETLNSDVLYQTIQRVIDSRTEFRFRKLPKSKLFSRAIGRNHCALNSRADIVWFCDCDYVFGEGCLESVVEQVVDDGTIYYPKTHFITESHELGAQLLRDNADVLFPEINPAHYVPKRVTKAIGGLQIVTGNTARKYGYLDGTKWMKPVSEEGGFRNTRCDIAYRASIPLSRAIEVPNLYRLRHQVEGLFLDAEGKPRR